MLPVQSYSAQPAGAILPFGAMPAPTALTSVATITPRTSAVHSEVAPPFSAPLLASASPSSIGSRLQSQTGIPITTMAISTTAQVLPGPKGVILSPAFQPIPARLVQRINSAKFVEMRDLLSDNIALHDQLESVHGPLQTISTPGFFASSDARGSFSYLLGVLFCGLCGHTKPLIQLPGICLPICASSLGRHCDTAATAGKSMIGASGARLQSTQPSAGTHCYPISRLPLYLGNVLVVALIALCVGVLITPHHSAPWCSCSSLSAGFSLLGLH